MCALCDLIDYPVADCWRPCYDPKAKQKPKGYIPVQRNVYSDQNESGWEKVEELVKTLNLKQREIDRLKDQAHHHSDSRDSFEGVE